MELGTVYPVTDLGTDPDVLRAFAQGAEDLGYDDLYLSEHILGADRSVRPDWRPYNPTLGQAGPPLYDYTYPFLESFVAFGFLAAVTKRLTLAAGLMVLGQRETVLVAKQSAIADVLSGGRVRLYVGSGWNDVEYEAMGVDFHSRGERIEEQIALLRALWTQEVVTFEGRWHKVIGAGINPLPVQRPIPIWIGGRADRVLRRAARIGDGFDGFGGPNEEGRRRLERLGQLAMAVGRDPASISALGAVTQGDREPEALVEEAQAWEAMGATHVRVRTSSYPYLWPGRKAMGRRPGVDVHLDALRRFKAEWVRASS